MIHVVSEWSDMYIEIEIQLRLLVYHKADYIAISLNVTCSRFDIFQ